MIIAETSARSYIGLEKCLVFVLLSAWVSDINLRNTSIRLKFDTNALYKISYIVLDVHCPNNACTGIYKSILIHYGLWKKILQNQFSRDYCAYTLMKFAYVTRILSRIVYLENGWTLPNLSCKEAHKINNNRLRSIKIIF